MKRIPTPLLLLTGFVIALTASCGDADYSGSGVDTANNDNNTVNNDNNTVNNDNNVMPIEPERHRASADACDNERPPSDAGVNYPDDQDLPCRLDSDCTEGDNGRCQEFRFGPECTYDGCFEDNVCEGTVCLCGEGSSPNRCLSRGECQTDANCGPGGFCSPSFGDCGSYSGVVGFYCHTPEDTCTNDSECAADPTFSDWAYCAFNPAVGAWMCSEAECDG